MKERERFIASADSGLWTMSELCRRHGISRKTGYKWLERFEGGGHAALQDRSRAPHDNPNRVPEELIERLVAVKEKHPTWGARKVLGYLSKREPRLEWPAESTVNEHFWRLGLVKPRRRQRKPLHPGRPYAEADAPNVIWSTDYKGHFRTRDHVYCYPLTIADLYSRYVLRCQALVSTKSQPTRKVFEKLFREVGMPEAILSDNGVPFCAPTAIHGLCALNLWWMELGIRHLRTQPGKPQQNGVHERMHRTLKEETTRPPAKNAAGQQVKFSRFLRIYNEERPHEALGNDTPAEHWRPPTREYPSRIRGPEYPDHFVIRRVSDGGHFRFDDRQPHLAKAMRGRDIGLEEKEDGVWSIYFYRTLIARYDCRSRKISM